MNTFIIFELSLMRGPTEDEDYQYRKSVELEISTQRLTLACVHWTTSVFFK